MLDECKKLLRYNEFYGVINGRGVKGNTIWSGEFLEYQGNRVRVRNIGRLSEYREYRSNIRIVMSVLLPLIVALIQRLCTRWISFDLTIMGGLRGQNYVFKFLYCLIFKKKTTHCFLLRSIVWSTSKYNQRCTFCAE